MSDDTRAKLRAMSLDEVTERCQRAMNRHQTGAFWRYYFELSLRKLEAQASGLDPLDEYEPEQRDYSADDLREHIRFGGTRSDY